jgi:predicted dehydrogenase
MKTNDPSSSPGGLPRRQFIKQTATVAAAAAATSWLKTPVYGQNQAPSANVTGANNKIAVAVVGVGFGIGKNHLLGIHDKSGENNTVLAAACDLYSDRRNFAKEKGELKDSDVYADYRKLLERKDIDAVLCATHDVWHAQITIDSLESGKHVYCEKPLTRYLDEAFKVYDTVKKTGKVFQVGSQGCSAGGYHKCAEMAKAGKLGPLVWGQAWYSRNSVGGEWNYPIEKDATEQNIDWEHWLGKVKKRTPFTAEHFHRWRKYYQYCAGPLGDLAPHRLHPLLLATGNPEFPVRVVSIGTKNVHADLANAEKPTPPERDVPEHAQLLAEFPSGFVAMVTCCTVNGNTPGLSIYGHKGTVTIDATASRAEFLPQTPFAEESDPETATGLQAEVDPRIHEKDWFECIRTGKKPNADIDLAIKVQTVLSLAEMSDRLKTTCLFDEKTRKITDACGKELPPITYGTLPIS